MEMADNYISEITLHLMTVVREEKCNDCLRSGKGNISQKVVSSRIWNVTTVMGRENVRCSFLGQNAKDNKTTVCGVLL